MSQLYLDKYRQALATHPEIVPPKFPLLRLPRPSWGRIGLIVVVGIFLLFLTLPLVALIWRAIPSLLLGLGLTSTVMSALQISLLTTTLSALIAMILGTPTAYVLARHHFPGRAWLDTLVELPLVLPPAVAGIALLMAFGRRGLVGQSLAEIGLELPFTMSAVVMAQVFVSAPLYIRAAKTGFGELNPRMMEASAILGKTPLQTFYQVTLPLARPALISGFMMTWARALGEFGATMLFAGNLAGRTQTMPLAIYAALQSDVEVALVLGVILLGASLAVLAGMRLLPR